MAIQAVLWQEAPYSTPIRRNLLTDCHKKLATYGDVGDSLLHTKFHRNLPRGVFFLLQFSPSARLSRFLSCLASSSLQPRPVYRFLRKIRQKTSCRICFLGFRKYILIFSTPFPPKNRHFVGEHRDRFIGFRVREITTNIADGRQYETDRWEAHFPRKEIFGISSSLALS